jgi:hypothetical protein
MTRTMINSQWPGLGSAVDFSSLDGGVGGPRTAIGAGGDPFAPPATPDGVARPWWTCGTSAGNGTGAGNGTTSGSGFDPYGLSAGGTNSISGLLTNIMNALQQFASTLAQGGGIFSSSPSAQQTGYQQSGYQQTGYQQTGSQQPGSPQCTQPGQQPPWQNQWPQQPWQPPSQQQTPGQQQPPWQRSWQQSPGALGGVEQRFSNVDISSSGDPHLAEVGTREGPGGNQSVDQHWNSMSSHPDLVHTDQIAGGYRVSTAVTTPNAAGVTYNQSATVHTNYGQDSVTMNRDGSFSIDDDGRAIALAKGQRTTLAGGATVNANDDGSLTVTASNAYGGSIATTLRSTGSGVDVDSQAHEIALGGDAITHVQN